MRLFIEPIVKHHYRKGRGWFCSASIPLDVVIKTNGPVRLGTHVRSEYNGPVKIEAGRGVRINGEVKKTEAEALESLRKTLVKAGFRARILTK